MLSEERIKSFQAVYKKVLGKDITREEAFEKGSALIRLMQIIYKPMTVKEWEQLQKRRLETGDITEKEFQKLIKDVNLKSNKGTTER